MRCPKCGNFAAFSFYDELNDANVYRCGTATVETERTVGGRTDLVRTLDHSDVFFRVQAGHAVYVNPRRLGKEASEAILKGKGWEFEKDERNKRIVPTVWTTSLA